jgi:hypothetical protein
MKPFYINKLDETRELQEPPKKTNVKQKVK